MHEENDIREREISTSLALIFVRAGRGHQFGADLEHGSSTSTTVPQTHQSKAQAEKFETDGKIKRAWHTMGSTSNVKLPCWSNSPPPKFPVCVRHRSAAPALPLPLLHGQLGSIRVLCTSFPDIQAAWEHKLCKVSLIVPQPTLERWDLASVHRTISLLTILPFPFLNFSMHSVVDVALPPVLQEVDNICVVESQVKSAKVPTLPQRYVFEPSVIGSIDGRSNITLPVVDLAGLNSQVKGEREAVVKTIGSVASKWGLFQIVNHGFPQKTIHALYDQARTFFDLPVDVKEAAIDPSDLSHGYEGRWSHKRENTAWMEYLAQKYRPNPQVEALGEQIWPGGNPTFCNAIHEYCKSAEQLGKQLMEVLAEALGLQPNIFRQHFDNPTDYQSSWRFHHHPACPEPWRTMGTPQHSDTSILTILRQDMVGGLQVREGDRFIDVTPVPEALTVNVGDVLQAWTNGRYRSVSHRVVVNEKSDRISLVYLFYGGMDLLINCPPELVDDTHPSLYVPFTVREYRMAKLETLRRGGEKSRTMPGRIISAFRRPREGSEIELPDSL